MEWGAHSLANIIQILYEFPKHCQTKYGFANRL